MYCFALFTFRGGDSEGYWANISNVGQWALPLHLQIYKTFPESPKNYCVFNSHSLILLTPPPIFVNKSVNTPKILLMIISELRKLILTNSRYFSLFLAPPFVCCIFAFVNGLRLTSMRDARTAWVITNSLTHQLTNSLTHKKMETNKATIWSKVLQILITVLTAIATTFGVVSCLWFRE